MARARIRAEVSVDAPVRHEDPIVEIEVPIEMADPIDEGSAFVTELRANLRAQGVTGEAQHRVVAERWLARNR